ncbi:MAG: alpha/beta hydrolase [Opitutales bacterium]|nr:alpha/beta hydrolase [Opitutales bacterium]
MKKLIAILMLASSCAFANAPFMNLWDGVKMPGFKIEEAEYMKGKIIPGRKHQSYDYKNVSTPAIQIYALKSGKPTAAVIVCPGGAYSGLVYGKEGEDIANYLNSIGVSAFILKYRVSEKKDRDAAFNDIQRAIRLVRANAKKFNIDPGRVGVMGFSAGGHLSARASTGYSQESYAPLDKIDEISARPDFTILIYPAWLDNRKDYGLAPEFKVDSQTPAAFIVQAQNDTGLVNSSIAYYLALKDAGVDADLHLYSKGGHAYGILQNGLPIDNWHKSLTDWLVYKGLAKKSEDK